MLGIDPKSSCVGLMVEAHICSATGLGPHRARAAGEAGCRKFDHTYPMHLGGCQAVRSGDTALWVGKCLRHRTKLELAGGPWACKEARAIGSQALGHPSVAGICWERAENGVGAPVGLDLAWG